MKDFENRLISKGKNRGTDKLPFGRILSALIRRRGLTLKQTAESAQVGTSVVQGWLSGANPHDLWAVYRLAEHLGVSFQYLLLGRSSKALEEGPPELKVVSSVGNVITGESLLEDGILVLD